MSEIVKEIEKVFFICIDDNILDDIKRHAVSKETQEQHEIACFDSDDRIVRFRVRKTNGEDIVYTMKPKVKGIVDCTEYNRPSDEKEFQLFKLVAFNSFYKTRYSIPSEVEGIVFEIDVFYDINGKAINWAKVDVEFKAHGIDIPEFPIKVNGRIDRESATDEEKEFINKIYTKYNHKYKEPAV